MTHRSNVVPKMPPLTEDQFLARWLKALNRLCRTHGDDQVALWLGVTVRHMRNLKKGLSLPAADKIWNLLAWDQTAHVEMDKPYGLKKVDRDDAGESGRASLLLAKIHLWLIEAMDPKSPGGARVVGQEVRPVLPMLLEMQQQIGSWIEAAEPDDRAPLRSVG